MILAQNLQLRLSGNNTSIFILVLTLFLAGCATTKPSRTERPSRTIKPKPAPSQANTAADIDTVEWVFVNDESHRPITNTKAPENPLRKDINTVSLLIPFVANSDTAILTRNEKKFSHFYAGCLMAMSELEKRNVTMEMNVFDTRRSRSQISKILGTPSFKQSDVVVGPYETSNLKNIAQWGMEYKVPVISPWRSSINITHNNSYFYQIRPLIEQYFETILKDALSQYNPSQLYILENENGDDKSKVGAFQKLYEAMNNGKVTEPLQTYKINQDSISNNEFLMFDSLLTDVPNIAFIIPNYTYKDARYIYSVIRKLNAELLDRKVTIYGMPTLINSDRLDLQFFKSLKLLTVDFKLFDKSNYRIKEFREEFYQKFGHLPNEDSYHGYNTIITIANYKLASDYSMDTSPSLPLIGMSIDFKPYFQDLSNLNLDFKEKDFYVNDRLGVIEYLDGRFVIRKVR